MGCIHERWLWKNHTHTNTLMTIIIEIRVLVGTDGLQSESDKDCGQQYEG